MATFKTSDRPSLTRIIEFICNLDLSVVWEVTIKRYVKNRTLQQNRLMWKWHGIMGNEIGCTADDWHQEMMNMFLPPKFYTIDDIAKERAKSTKKLTVKEFTEYLEHIDRHCASFHGVMLPRLEDMQRHE